VIHNTSFQFGIVGEGSQRLFKLIDVNLLSLTFWFDSQFDRCEYRETR
jgi:hypothetical protein